MSRAARTRNVLLLTCEHGGNRIPRSYAHLFSGSVKLLESHRGWDRGALQLARLLSRELQRPLLAVTLSRLFVEANRSPTNRRIWSDITKGLPRAERLQILEKWWRPHRQQVERAVADAITSGHRVVHVAVHSFTPELDGEVRSADVGLLYDSRRKDEAAFSRGWALALRVIDPALRVRFNYPYAGAADGLTTWMRRLHPQSSYIGVELEINQALVGSPRWRSFQRHVAETLRLSIS